MRDEAYEAERLTTLQTLGLLDGKSDAAFDRLTSLAKRLTGSDVALITLIDGTRQWFKSCAGPVSGAGTAREEAICNHTIQGEGVFWVMDAKADPAFHTFPTVKDEPHIRFYAGAPITVDGYAIGSLCVLGSAPRKHDPDVEQVLLDLADIAADQSRNYGALPKVQARQEIERKFRQLFENSGDALIFLRLGEGGRWTHEHANRAALGLFGYADHELIGRTPEEVFGGEGADCLSSQATECIREGVSIEYEASFASANGEKSLHSTLTPMYRDDGGAWGVLVSARDVSHQRRELASSFEAQKFEAIGQLAGGVAHDFNNLLLVIGGFARQGLDPKGSLDDARDCLGEVLKAADRANRLVQQLLTFSRRRLLEKKPFVALQGIIETEKLLSPLLGVRHPLIVKSSDCSLVQVETDSGEFSQAITNLVLNARDAMPDGGVIDLELNLIHVSAGSQSTEMKLPPGAYLSITVRDGGHGMDPATVSRIFDPFFTTKEQGKGTGLGLAMVHGFARQSGGAIHVESTPEIGSSFHLLLPTVARTAQLIEPEERDVTTGSGELILLVEDDPQVRTLNELALESFGYRVVSARDGIEALEMECENSVDLVLTDVVMPGLGGFELAEILHRTSPDLPVIFTSGYPTRGPAQAVTIPEGSTFISKPYTPAQLARVIRSLLDTQQRRGRAA